MKELKVGKIPPPQPRELLSSQTALLSRAPTIPRHISKDFYRKLDQLSTSLTERFRTGYIGVLTATRKELEEVQQPTVPDKRLIHTTDQQITVGIASGNDVKIKDLIRVVSQHAQVANIPEAEEKHTLSTKDDALSKAKSAAEILSTSQDTARREVRTRPHLTIATDVVNKRLIEVTDDTTGLTHLAYQPLGKPNNLRDIHGNELSKEDQEQSVKKMFGSFAKMAEKRGWPAVPYTIEMSTVMYNPKDPDNLAFSTQKSSVFLSKEGVKYLATDEGFTAYKGAVQQAGFDITRTAGGFELDVLDNMGFVEYITGTPDDIISPQFVPQRDNAKNHAYSIAVGNVDAKLVEKYFTHENQGEQVPTLSQVL